MTKQRQKDERLLYTPAMATITRVERLTDKEKLFEIKLGDEQNLNHKPGQFVEVSVLGVGEAPISVSSSPSRSNGSFELAIREVGNVTNALHRMEPDAKVGIRGPFGTTFPVQDLRGQDLLFVAGGIGLVPLRSLINEVLDHREDYGRVIILFGAKSPPDRLFVKELEEWQARADVEYFDTVDKADDTWDGNVGVITTLFSKVSIEPATTYCVVVGPPIMYRFVIVEAKKMGISDDRILVSLERRMKCGVGKCGHCQINGTYVCQDGPVFRYSDILHLQEAF